MQNNENFAGTPNELFPIIEHEGVHVVDSRLIADYLGIEHRALLQTINKHQTIIEATFQRVAFEMRPFETKGGAQHIRIALLTEGQALFIATLSKNTFQVVAFKAKITKSFLDARMRLEAGKNLLADLREEMLMAEIKKLASRVENMEQQYQWLLDAHEDLAESMRHILEELPHAQTLFEILLERTHKLEMSKEVQELKNTLLATIQLLQGRVQDIERALNLHTKHFVYVFYNVITDEYRIGKANILDKRQRQLHTVEQDIRQYLAIATRNAREALLLERYLQTYFDEKRTQGDWFKFDAEDLKMLALFALLHETV